MQPVTAALANANNANVKRTGFPLENEAPAKLEQIPFDFTHSLHA
jgi:hypothetical protein